VSANSERILPQLVIESNVPSPASSDLQPIPHVVSPTLVTSPLSLAGSLSPVPEDNSPLPATPPSPIRVQSPSPEPFIPPPPPFVNRPQVGRYFYQHLINGLPALGVISDPVFFIPLLPNGPFVSYLTLHICEHARLIHTQTFCYCTDVRTGTMFLIPWYNLSAVITPGSRVEAKEVGISGVVLLSQPLTHRAGEQMTTARCEK
jgi:hypothetical protein